MNLSSLLKVALGLVISLLPGVAGAQEQPQREPFASGAKCLSAEHNAAKSDAVTKEQADAIVSELKQIRLLLEKQEAQLARAVAPQPSAAPAPPQKVQMSVGNGWYSLGRPDAPVTLVEFGDYQCPFCKQFHTTAYSDLKKNYIDTGKVRFVSRDLPLEFHPFALRAAEAARCAGDQGKYWEMRDALYASAPSPTMMLSRVPWKPCRSTSLLFSLAWLRRNSRLTSRKTPTKQRRCKSAARRLLSWRRAPRTSSTGCVS